MADTATVDIPGTLTSLGTLIAAVGAVAIGFRNSRKADAAKDKAAIAATAAAVAKEAALASQREVMVVGDKVVEVGKQLDGRLSELLREARASARAEGVAAGEQAQRDRASEAQP
jgi:hypothetical protein